MSYLLSVAGGALYYALFTQFELTLLLLTDKGVRAEWRAQRFMTHVWALVAWIFWFTLDTNANTRRRKAVFAASIFCWFVAVCLWLYAMPEGVRGGGAVTFVAITIVVAIITLLCEINKAQRAAEMEMEDH